MPDEFLEQLPHLIRLSMGMSWGEFRLHVVKTETHYWVEYFLEGFKTDKIAPIRQADMPANGLAQMWLHIKEQNELRRLKRSQ
jgi:hypothetical protein